jgi:D-alanine-D-alanine ligase
MADNGSSAAGDGDPLMPRRRVSRRRRSAATRALRVAVLHNSVEHAPAPNGSAPPDSLAELDTLRNVADYVAALRQLGHEVSAHEGNLQIPARLAEAAVDICFNTCEGLRGDSREAQVPALLEMMGMPYTASKVLALAVTLDKAMTKRVLGFHGLPTPRFQEFNHPGQPIEPGLREALALGRPLFVKPNREGTGIGIYRQSLVYTEAELRERVAQLRRDYKQTVLAEEYVEGRDVTCGLVGNLGADGSTDNLHVFPISEVDYAVYPPGTEPFYSFNLKVHLADDYRTLCPAPIPDHIADEVRRLTVETFRACGCLDVARVDFRLDVNDNLQPMILEINALPGMAWNSDLTMCAQADGWTHYELLQAVFQSALDRYGLPGAPGGVREPNFRSYQELALALAVAG